MGISTLQLMKNATSATVVGGTAADYKIDGVEIKNGVHLVDVSEPDFTIRPSVTLSTRPPSRLPDGSFTKDKRKMSVVVPKDLDGAGNIVYNLGRIEIEAHPKTTPAEILNIYMLLVQMCFDADLSDYRDFGATT